MITNENEHHGKKKWYKFLIKPLTKFFDIGTYIWLYKSLLTGIRCKNTTTMRPF